MLRDEWVGTRQEAEHRCALHDGCTAIHDWSCDNRNWRYCSSVTLYTTGAACISYISSVASSPAPPPSPPPPSPPSCNVFDENLANHEGSNLLYISPGLVGDRHHWLGATGGAYNAALLEKCCAACNYGSYNGLSYTFTSDSDGLTAATCQSFTLRFLNDSSFGYYCTFSTTALPVLFNPNGAGAAGSGLGSAALYTSAHFYAADSVSHPPLSPCSDAV